MEKLASKYWIVLITFLLINTNGFSQNLDSIKVKKFTITTSVLDYASVLFFNATNYNLEIAKSFKNRKSVHVNLGYIKSFAPIVDKGFVNFTIPTSIGTKGYKLQFEGRHYLNKHKLFEPVFQLLNILLIYGDDRNSK